MELTDEQIKQAEREYHKAWRENNPEKVKKNRKRFFAKKAKEMLEAQ